MALQDTYVETMAAGVPGAIADTNHKVLISRTVEGAPVGFGVPLAQGAGDYGARATTTGDTAIVGITVRDQSTFGDQFEVGESARVLTTGTLWINTVAAVVAGDPVHVIVADATFSNTGGVAIDGARFEDSGDAGSTLRVRID